MDNTTFAQKDENGVFVLVDQSNAVAFCPFVTRVLVPAPNKSGVIRPGEGQLMIHREPCSSLCPFFVVGVSKVVISCREKQIDFLMQDKPELKIIKDK